jgi:hypothetical protein
VVNLYPDDHPLNDDMQNRRYPILRFFEAGHLPDRLAMISLHFRALAWNMVRDLPYCVETSTCLRKLLEAKDCAVRAALDA